MFAHSLMVENIATKHLIIFNINHLFTHSKVVPSISQEHNRF